MKKIIIVIGAITLVGCSTIQQYWPRDHDPIMFNHLVSIDIAIDNQNCDAPTWATVANAAEQLARYAEWRSDPQAANLRGLQKYIDRLSQGGSKTFCELGKKTAKTRVDAAKTAWEGR